MHGVGDPGTIIQELSTKTASNANICESLRTVRFVSLHTGVDDTATPI